MSLEPPKKFDLGNWPEFCDAAVKYHNAVRPEQQLLSDRIETCYELMSPRAKKYLDGLVRPHPRYRTTKGWKEWASTVESMLELYPKILGAVNYVGKFRPPMLLVRRTSKLPWRRGLWMALDRRVSDGSISSAEQRQKFWAAHDETGKRLMRLLCPAFDVHNEVWLSEVPGVIEVTEQKLHEIMELYLADDVAAVLECSRQTLDKYGPYIVTVFVMLLLLLLMFVFMLPGLLGPGAVTAILMAFFLILSILLVGGEMLHNAAIRSIKPYTQIPRSPETC